MDSNPAKFDDLFKKQLSKELVQQIIYGLETKQLNLLQMKASASYVLDNLNKIKEQSQLIAFLENLKSQWPVYTNLYTIYKNKLSQNREKIVLDKLTSYINTVS